VWGQGLYSADSRCGVRGEARDEGASASFPQPVRAGLHRVLVEKLRFTLERATAAGELLAQLATERPGAPQRVEAITGDPAREAILASAIEAGVDVLVTRDKKHLLPIVEHHGVKLLTPWSGDSDQGRGTLSPGSYGRSSRP